jgi:hypothetical protein
MRIHRCFDCHVLATRLKTVNIKLANVMLFFRRTMQFFVDRLNHIVVIVLCLSDFRTQDQASCLLPYPKPLSIRKAISNHEEYYPDDWTHSIGFVSF